VLARSIPAYLIACLFLLGVVGIATTGIWALSDMEPPPFLYTVAKHYEPLAWTRGAERFLSGATIFVHDSAGRHPLIPSFAESADPAVSFDGQRILFAGKPKAQDPWQIWELPLAGGEPRRITAGPEDCIRPFYLPDDRVVYARKIAGRFAM